MKKSISHFLILKNEVSKFHQYSKNRTLCYMLCFSIGVTIILITLATNSNKVNSTPLFISSLFFIGTTFSSLYPTTKKRPAKRIDSHKTSKRTGYTTYTKIKEYIITEKKYMSQDISLGSLSNDFEISKGYISQLINTYAQKSFSDYINELRVEESKKKLLDTGYNNYTIESIGLECGFKSKSNFYTAFKKFTKQTPNQFKSKQYTS